MGAIILLLGTHIVGATVPCPRQAGRSPVCPQSFRPFAPNHSARLPQIIPPVCPQSFRPFAPNHSARLPQIIPPVCPQPFRPFVPNHSAHLSPTNGVALPCGWCCRWRWGFHLSADRRATGDRGRSPVLNKSVARPQ